MPSCLGFYCIKISSLLNKLKALLFSVLKKVHMFLSTYFLNIDSKCTTVGQVKSGLPSMIISRALYLQFQFRRTRLETTKTLYRSGVINILRNQRNLFIDGSL